MKENVILDKSFDFALKIIEIYRYLVDERREFVLSKQLLRSGTSIGANCQESISAQSRKDFISKLSVALKEARETHYWLRLLKASGYISEKQDLSAEIDEIIRILSSIIISTKKNVRN